MKTNTGMVAGMVVAIASAALLTSAVFAAVSLVETSTETIGATTITWDSSFADPNYTEGDTVTFTVTWSVDAGAASYDGFVLRTNKKGGNEFTPRSKKDPVEGELISAVQSDNSVTVEFKFTSLHWDEARNIKVGNAHFFLDLLVDVDGDETPETIEHFGVNLHVEDPQ